MLVQESSVFCREIAVSDSEDNSFVQATALDSDTTSSLICLGGRRCMFILHVGVEDDNNRRERREEQSINEDSFFSQLRTSRSDVTLVRWRQNDKTRQLIASTSGQCVDLFQLGDTGLFSIDTATLHPRNVADLDWCPYSHNLMATCSLDDAVSIWDVNNGLRQPVLQLHVVAGAVQAKWSPHCENIIATAHGTDYRIWDIRKATSPISSVAAHLEKMTSLCWHPINDTSFLTAGQDYFLKLWDFSCLNKPRQIVGPMKAPIWKIRCSRSNFVSLPIPQAGRPSVSALSIWMSNDLDNMLSVKCEDDLIVDACWLTSPSSNFSQLYTLSKNHRLRRWPISALLLQEDNEQEETRADIDNRQTQDGNVTIQTRNESAASTESSDPSRTESPATSVSPRSDEQFGQWLVLSPGSVNGEMEALRNLRDDSIVTDEINFNRQAVGLKYERSTGQQIKLVIRFHQSFSINGNVHIRVMPKESSIATDMIERLLKAIHSECEQQRRSTPNIRTTVLVRVMKKLSNIVENLGIFGKSPPAIKKSISVGIHDALFSIGKPSPPVSSHKSSIISELGVYNAWVPSPRTSGARFNGSGFLVVFGNMQLGQSGGGSSSSSAPFRSKAVFIVDEKRTSKRTSDGGVPRSLEEYERRHVNLSSTHGLITSPQFSRPARPLTGTSFTLPPPIRTAQTVPGRSTRQRGISLTGSSYVQPLEVTEEVAENTANATVVIYDASEMLPISKQLASLYSLVDGDALDLCERNRMAAETVKRWDLAQTWSLLEQGLRQIGPGSGTVNVWNCHPLGRQMVHSLLDYYGRISDFQTAAMLSCVLGAKINRRSSPANTVEKSETITVSQSSNYLHVRSASSSTVTPMAARRSNRRKIAWLLGGLSGHNTIHSGFTSTVDGLVAPMNASNQPVDNNFLFLAQQKQNQRTRSNSLDEEAAMVEERRTFSRPISSSNLIDQSVGLTIGSEAGDYHEEEKGLLDVNLCRSLEAVRLQYADVLRRWLMVSKATEVLKYCDTWPSIEPVNVQRRTRCVRCGVWRDGRRCTTCNVQLPNIRCVICQLPVKGLCSACPICFHGGHLSHMEQWFDSYSQCPTGCGCLCVQ